MKEEINVGDFVYPTENYKNLENSFYGKPRQVVRIERKKLPYAGNAFVFVDILGKEYGFYIIALKKVK